MKITFMGAGSTVFARNVLGDCMCTPALCEAEIALYDINEERLKDSEIILGAINKNVNESRATIKTYLGVENRKEALRDADFVVNAIQVGGYDPCTITDFEIPKKYGLRQTIADTLGIGGIMRALRTIPVMEEFARDMEEVCPNTLFLNYTNPMAMLTGYMQRYTKIRTVGLCHSVQGTVAMLAEWLETPVDEIDYLCAGVNHQAFYLKLEHNGQDLYPKLAKKLENPKFYNKEQVRNEMFRHLGYYVTESSGHNSEYNAWFRKRPDLIENYCTHSTNWNPGLHAFSLNSRLERAGSWKQEITDWIENEPVDTNRSSEYAANIFNARFGDRTPFKFNGNVINDGSITNLPYDACVEIPVFADKDGIHKTIVGELPAHLAILVSTTAQIENLVVRAAMTKSRADVYHAVMMDPLCSAVCSLQEIRDMCDLIFEKNTDYLGDYK